jgi:hypothetical protein
MKEIGVLLILILIVIVVIMFIHCVLFKENFEDSDELMGMETEEPGIDQIDGMTYDDLDTSGEDPRCSKSRYVRGLGYSKRHNSHVKTH